MRNVEMRKVSGKTGKGRISVQKSSHMRREGLSENGTGRLHGAILRQRGMRS